jgi:osmoprotectant transport system substrate-binding protein
VRVWRVRQVRRHLAPAVVAMATVLALAATSVSCSDAGSAGDAGPSSVPRVPGPTIEIRGLDFAQSATIAEVYGQYLAANGYTVEILAAGGTRAEAVASLRTGAVDLVVDSVGRLATTLAADVRLTAEPDQVITVLKPLLAGVGATVLDYASAADGDAFVVRGDSPARTISNVKNLDYVLGASAECEAGRKCYIGLTDPDVYGITFRAFRRLEVGPRLGPALAARQVDAVVWTTTAPQISQSGFKILEDDKRLFPAQNIAPVVATAIATAYGDRLADDLNRLSEAITTDDLTAWNVETELDHRPSPEVAREWLEKKGLA